MRLLKKIICLLSAISICFNTVLVYAGDLIIQGTAIQALNLTADKEYFIINHMVAPGDYWSSIIKLKNSSKSKSNIQIKLVTIKSLLSDTVLFDNINLKIKKRDKIIYNGPYNAEPSTDYYILKPNQEINWDITMSIPNEIGNKLQGRMMDSIWIFEANYDYEFNPTPATMPVPTETHEPSIPSKPKYAYEIRYVDENGKEIHDRTILSGEVGTTITVYPVTINGYAADQTSQKFKITSKIENNVVIFTYKKNSVETTPTPIPAPTPNPEEDLDDDPSVPKEPTPPITSTPKPTNPTESELKSEIPPQTGTDENVSTYFYSMRISGSCFVFFMIILLKRRKKY